ncbi:MAG: LysM peptidoglycan-binding domain-containing protein [Chthoniobacter sp.]|nr:LysM peptidoglycan-binding domain-containing protein [Chthoniobacter sp.]
MKTPKFFAKLSAVVTARFKKRKLRAATTMPRSAMDSYEADEPVTKLSSAFVVVLILHVVAVGGIYAFNSIKASRRGHEQSVTTPAVPEKSLTVAKTNEPNTAIPTAKAAVAETARGTVSPVTSPKPAVLKSNQYLVKANDNPTKIAAMLGVKTEDLLAANKLKAESMLHPGDILIIPKPTPKPLADARKAEANAKPTDVAPTKAAPGVHVVKKNETAISIAKLYNLPHTELLKLNKISDPTKIREGQSLVIPKKKG